MTGPERVSLDELVRIVDSLDKKVGSLDAKLDSVVSNQDQMKGVLSVLRWLGPSGLAIAVVALIRAFG